MKKKSQIITIVGTTTVTISTALGVYFSFQNWSVEPDKVYNFGEKFFRKYVVSNKNYLYNEINLLDGGENLGYLNQLDKLHFNNSKNKEILKKDPNNNLLANDRLIIDFSKMYSVTQIKEKYKELNKKLDNVIKKFNREKMSKFKNEILINDLGIEFVQDVANSKVEIKLFEIKSFNKEDLELINSFISDLGPIIKPKEGWVPNNFFRMYGPKSATSRNHLNSFKFSLPSNFDEKWPEKNLTSQIDGKFFAEYRREENNNEVSTPSKEMKLNKKFYQKNIFSSIEPFVDFKNKKAQVVIKFYKTSAGNISNNIDKTLLKDNINQTNIWNPQAIKTKIFEYDLLNFGNTIAPSRTKAENKEILKNFFIRETSVSVWANQKVVNLVLSLLQEKVPQLISYSEKIFFLGEIFGSKKYSSIFNEEEKVKLIVDGKEKKEYFLDWLLEELQNNQYIDAEAFLASADQFSSKTTTKLNNEKLLKYTLASFKDWNDLEKLRFIDNKNGGLYKIYHFHITMNEVYDKIIEIIENKFGPINFKKHNENAFKILFEFFKKKNLIEYNVDFNAFIDGYEKLIPNLLSKIVKKGTEIPKNIIEVILSILSFSNYSENFDLLVDNLYELFLTNKFSLIWKIFGKNEEERIDTIKNLLSSKTSYLALMNILKNNKLKTKEPIQELLIFLSKTKLLPSFLSSLSSENMHKFLTEEKNGKTNGTIVSEFVAKMVSNGIKSLSLIEMKELIKVTMGNNDKLAEQIYNFIQNGLGGNQLDANDSIEGIISLIKLFLNKFSSPDENNEDDTKWFDVNKISYALNKFLNYGFDELDIASYKTIFQIIFKDLKPIEDIAKKLGLQSQENIAPKLRDFIAKISYEFLNQGVSNFDNIKTKYDEFINNSDNSEIKIALHTFINQKITKKEEQIQKIKYVDTFENELTGEWDSWNNKYIPKINFSCFNAPSGQTTINSLLEMNLIDFVLVFSEDANLDPIKMLEEDEEHLRNKLNFNSYKEYKNYFGTLFESFKRFYDNNGQFFKSNKDDDVSNEFKNYNFLNKIKKLSNDKNYGLFFDLLITSSSANGKFEDTKLNVIFKKFLKLTIKLAKTGVSTSKNNWIEHIKNIVDFIKNINPIINPLSTLIPTINDYANKYIYGLVEILEIGQKQSDGNYEFIDPTDDGEGKRKVEEIATSISNIFKKSINDSDDKNNILEKDLNFIWKITKYFLKVINENDKKFNDKIDNLPKKIPISIKRILVDKESFGNLSSSDIDELMFVLSSLYPNSEKVFDISKNFIKQLLIGKNKMYLEDEVQNLYYENQEIEFISKGDNKFSTHDQKIREYLQINSEKGILNLEKLIIEDKNILLNKNSFVKFKAKFSYAIDGHKFNFISPEFKIKLSEKAKYNLKDRLALRTSNKLIDELSKIPTVGDFEKDEDKLIYKFNNSTNFKVELDKLGYELVKLKAILNDNSKYVFKEPFLLIVKKNKKAELKSWIEDLANLNGLNEFASTETFFENININNVLSDSKTIKRFELNDFVANTDKLIFKTNLLTNRANSHLGIYGIILNENDRTASPSSILTPS